MTDEADKVIRTFFRDQGEAINFLVALKEFGRASPSGKYVAFLRKKDPGKWLYTLDNTVADLFVGDYVRPFRCSQENVDRFNEGVDRLADLMLELEQIPKEDVEDFAATHAVSNAFGEIGFVEAD